MSSSGVDYRVSRLIVLCKDCGDDVGVYPSRHKCRTLERPPLPTLVVPKEEQVVTSYWEMMKNTLWSAEVTTASEESPGGLIWNKMMDATTTVARVVGVGIAGESDSDVDENGETKVTRELKAYYEKKGEGIPDFLLTKNGQGDNESRQGKSGDGEYRARVVKRTPIPIRKAPLRDEDDEQEQMRRREKEQAERDRERARQSEVEADRKWTSPLSDEDDEQEPIRRRENEQPERERARERKREGEADRIREAMTIPLRDEDDEQRRREKERTQRDREREGQRDLETDRRREAKRREDERKRTEREAALAALDGKRNTSSSASNDRAGISPEPIRTAQSRADPPTEPLPNLNERLPPRRHRLPLAQYEPSPNERSRVPAQQPQTHDQQPPIRRAPPPALGSIPSRSKLRVQLPPRTPTGSGSLIPPNFFPPPRTPTGSGSHIPPEYIRVRPDSPDRVEARGVPERRLRGEGGAGKLLIDGRVMMDSGQPESRYAMRDPRRKDQRVVAGGQGVRRDFEERY